MFFEFCKQKLASLVARQNKFRRVVVLPFLKVGHQLDFIFKVDEKKINCHFDLYYLFQQDETIKTIQYEVGDHSLVIENFTLKYNSFDVDMFRGEANSLSTIVFKLQTSLNRAIEFITLVSIVSGSTIKHQHVKSIVSNKLLISDKDPTTTHMDIQTQWFEGDMIIHFHTRQLWEYRITNAVEQWVEIFKVSSVMKPVPNVYATFKRVGTELTLQQICSDQGKILSSGDGSLTVDRQISSSLITTQSLVAGYPLGEGMIFTNQGMIAAHSLYVGSPESKPKNIFIGLPGVVSTKMVSVDYLQMAVLSVKELPVHVKIGTLVLCRGFNEENEITVLCAIKDNPDIADGWATLSQLNFTKKGPSSGTKPILYMVQGNGEGRDTNNIVDITQLRNNKLTTDIPSKLLGEKENASQTYSCFEFTQLIIRSSEANKALCWQDIFISNKEIHSELTNDHVKQFGEKSWKSPCDGLLHIQGSFLFNEIKINEIENSPYQAGDVFSIKITRCEKHKGTFISQKKIDFPLSPYSNPIKNCVCANQRINFQTTTLIEKDNFLRFSLSYRNQKTKKNSIKILSIKEALLEIYVV